MPPAAVVAATVAVAVRSSVLAIAAPIGKALAGKSRLASCMTVEMAEHVLFGHGTLYLDSHPDDYGKMRVYSGFSSLEEMSPGREKSYHLACALGAESSARVVSQVNYREAGVISDAVGFQFTEACSGAYIAPEVERDLLKEVGDTLLGAIDCHAVWVSWTL